MAQKWHKYRLLSDTIVAQQWLAIALTFSVDREEGIPVAEEGLLGDFEVASECLNVDRFTDDILLTLLWRQTIIIC